MRYFAFPKLSWGLTVGGGWQSWTIDLTVTLRGIISLEVRCVSLVEVALRWESACPTGLDVNPYQRLLQRGADTGVG
jgi:hypothetical protein